MVTVEAAMVEGSTAAVFTSQTAAFAAVDSTGAALGLYPGSRRASLPGRR
jgi:hypothetical protein